MDAFAAYDTVKTLNEIEEAAGVISLGTQSLDSDSISIFPNPFKNKIFVNLASISNKVSVKVYDILGKEIIIKNFNNNKLIELPVQNLSKGLYFINIEADSETYTKKIIKH